MYLVKIPFLVKLFHWDMIWSIERCENKIFLTFDDGPEPDITPVVLEILGQYNAKATFFFLGKKVLKYPEILEKVKKSGHTIGNHTFSHIRGKRTSQTEFFKDIARCDELLKSNLFRPPYGSISIKQRMNLNKKFKIIMWSVLPGDFDSTVTPEKCLSRSLRYTKGGSIIVFHDNIKSKEKVLFVLPRFLQHFSKLGYTFEALNEKYFR